MSFKGDITKFSAKALNEADKEKRAICSALFRSVVMDTPVDSGRLRGNWQISPNNPKRGTIERNDKGGGSTISAELRNLGKLADTVYMTNNLPYAQRIEYGYSKTHPAGMVRKNVARIKSLIARRRLSR